MSDGSDFFAQYEDQEPDETKRDRWGRPLLIPAKNRELDNYEDYRTAYTRASTLASCIENDTHITRWKMRYLARSLGMHEDLAALAGAEVYTTGFAMGDSKKNAASGKVLDGIIERALDRVRISEKADYGTLVHNGTEPEFAGNLPDRALADVESYLRTCRELGFIFDQEKTEVFTANDELKVAGTFDNLKWHPKYGWCITDKKTSAKVDGPHFAIQLAPYARGKRYDVVTDEMFDLETLTDGEEINRDVGLIFHIKNGKTTVHELDLVAGWKGAQIAAEARDYSAAKNGRHVDVELAEYLSAERAKAAQRIRECTALDDLRDVFADFSRVWTDELTEAGNRIRKTFKEA